MKCGTRFEIELPTQTKFPIARARGRAKIEMMDGSDQNPSGLAAMIAEYFAEGSKQGELWTYT